MSPERIRPGSGRSAPSEQPRDATAESEADETLASSSPELEVESPELDEPVAIEEAPTSKPAESVITDGEEDGGEETTAILLEVDEEAPVAAHHGRFRRLYYGETHFDFVRRRKTWFAISGAIVLAGIISLATQGLNLSIDFVGGTSWSVNTTNLTVAQVQQAIAPTGLTGATIVFLGKGTSRTVQVEAKLPSGESAGKQANEATAVATALQRLTHAKSINDISVESVGPSWGSQITNKAIVALIVFFILIALYISIFFEWRMALAAIVAVVHDILVTVGIYSLSGFLVTPDTVVAILTILGYSLYDTIVVFDRIRDNVKNLSVRDRLTFSDIVNVSMNQTLARSINTSAVAIMPILSVLVIGAELLGATTLQYFGLALLVGLTTGAYSSIFIASPLVAMMKEREPRYIALRERIEQRGPSRWLLSPAEVARGFGGDEVPGRARTATTVGGGGRVRPGSAATSGGSSSPAKRPSSPATPPRRPTARARRRGGRR